MHVKDSGASVVRLKIWHTDSRATRTRGTAVELVVATSTPPGLYVQRYLQTLDNGINSRTRFVEVVSPRGARFLEDVSVLGGAGITASHGVRWRYRGHGYLAPNLKGCLHYEDFGGGIPREPPCPTK